MLQEKLQEIEALVNSTPVVLFMKGTPDQPLCRFSLDVVRTLAKHDISYVSRDVLEDDVLREAIKVYSDWPTLPQLYLHGEFVGGRDIILDLDESGDLAQMLRP